MKKINFKFYRNISVMLSLVMILSSCGKIGPLVSNKRIIDADNNEVVVIGDSIFALSGKLQDYLEDYADSTFRRYTLSGAEITGGSISMSITKQFETAKSDDPNIDTVIMNGAGNDILLPVITLFDPHHCQTPWYQRGGLSLKCRSFIEGLYVDVSNLLDNMEISGVSNVVYLGYYYTKNALLLLDPLEKAVDYGNSLISEACDNSGINCVFIDPSDYIYDRDIIIDGIHPRNSASRKLADLIWPELEPLL
jgi:hypothetical protein